VARRAIWVIRYVNLNSVLVLVDYHFGCIDVVILGLSCNVCSRNLQAMACDNFFQTIKYLVSYLHVRVL
jgi:hypothetical protein